MIEMAKRGMKRALVAAAAVGLAGDASAANAQERGGAGEDIQNVLLTFDLIQADGFTDQDEGIRDVVTELEKLLNFRGYRLLSRSLFNVGMQSTDYDSEPLRGSGTHRVAVDSTLTLTIDVSVRAERSSKSVRATVTVTRATSWLTTRNQSPLLRASANMRDGQRFILGSTPKSGDEPVLILVVTPGSIRRL